MALVACTQAMPGTGTADGDPATMEPAVIHFHGRTGVQVDHFIERPRAFEEKHLDIHIKAELFPQAEILLGFSAPHLHLCDHREAADSAIPVFRALEWLDSYKPLIVPFHLDAGTFFIFLIRKFFLTIPLDICLWPSP